MVTAVGLGTDYVHAYTESIESNVVVVSVVPGKGRLEERKILVSFYNETGGENWTSATHWLSLRPLGDWHGITTNESGHVSGISLEDNNLHGHLPSELSGLTELKKLNLSRNDKLSGLLPRAFIELSPDELLLEGTRVCTPLSAANGFLTEWLNAISTKSVPICENYFDLATLEVLVDLHNQTNGRYWKNRTNWNSARPFGDWYGVSTNEAGQIIELNLADNNLEGVITSRFGKLIHLERLDLSGNDRLYGKIPRDYMKLDLVYLSLEGTQMCAPADSDFQSWLTEIPVYIVTECKVSDTDYTVLSELFVAMRGTNWNDRTNWLTENPLDTWHGVTLNADGRVSELDLSGNNLSGTISAEVAELSDLTVLDLSRNDLSGSIPRELGELSNLNELALTNNRLSGSIPSELGGLSNLGVLRLNGNRLSGSIPSELGELSNLGELTLGVNQLSGSIPSELGELSNLFELTLKQNNLSGSIPPELGELSNLGVLDLSQNNLEGRIPPELSQMASVFWMILSFNSFSGSIPATLFDMPLLTFLDLNDNQFSGSIPVEVATSTVAVLRLHNNSLSGPDPSGTG